MKGNMKVISYKGCLLLELFSKVPHFAKHIVNQRDIFIGEITTTFVCRTIVVRKCSYKKTTLYQLYFTKNVVLTRKCWFLVTLVWFLLLFGEFGNPLLIIIKMTDLMLLIMKQQHIKPSAGHITAFNSWCLRWPS